MNHKTVIIAVKATKQEVFDFLSRIENLPAWATEFCQGIKKEGAYYKVTTSGGELFFRIESDAKTGVVDMFAGPTLDQQGIFPCRVLAPAGYPTLILFTFFQEPQIPDEVFEHQYKSLLIEMDGLKRRFGAK